MPLPSLAARPLSRGDSPRARRLRRGPLHPCLVAAVLLGGLGCQEATLDVEAFDPKPAAVVPDVPASPDVADAGVDAAPPQLTCKDVCPDSGNPCKLNVCKNAICGLVDGPDATKCEDGNPCSEGEKCAKGECTGSTPKKCDDGNACTVDTCAKPGGCAVAAFSGACNTDGDTCTAETCKDNKCVYQGIAPSCDCTADTDCNAKGFLDSLNANLCNGKYFCDKSTVGKNLCVQNKATEIKCKPIGPDDMANPGDEQCRENKCNPKTGACEVTNKANNLACDDKIDCTPATCNAGLCTVSGAANQCDCLSKQDADCDTCSYSTPDLGFGSHCQKISDGKKNICAGKWYCDQTTRNCVLNKATVVKCSSIDDGKCQKTDCDSVTGKCVKNFLNNTKVCEDGDPCTVNDVCNSGKCTAGPVNTCPCTKNADCMDDGDLCNGVPFCQLSEDGKSNKCVINPASAVPCPTTGDSQCLRHTCHPKIGKCDVYPIEKLKKQPNCVEPDVGLVDSKCPLVPIDKGDEVWAALSCDDGLPCTASSSCKGGKCSAEPTSYICFCEKDADCKDDGDLCNGVPYCHLLAPDPSDAAKKKPACKTNPVTVKSCSPINDTICIKNSCDPKTGKCEMTPPFGKVYCDDGDPCTALGECTEGKCVNGIGICPCTSNADCKDKGDQCNGTAYCDKSQSPPQCIVNPATVIKCNPTFDKFCLANRCDKATGKCDMKPVKEYQLCDDGNPCTTSEVCTAGDCLAETNICICMQNSDCAKEEDSDICNGTLYCDKLDAKAGNKCVVNPATIVNCLATDDTECMHNTCDPKTATCAMKPVPNAQFVPCTDSNPCTKGDYCTEAGACKSGTDTCGCTDDLKCQQADDGNPCNGELFCDKTVPGAFKCVTKPNSVVSCPDGATGSCMVPKCDPKSGSCKAVESPGLCNDGNPCTLDSCTSDQCKKAPAPDGTACGPGLACKASKCEPK
ncbi:MAG: hypothetical protein EXR79_03890 [Myxococcales bacterium]|nr:hypothetical protein [Myxococcales bacterium]